MYRRAAIVYIINILTEHVNEESVQIVFGDIFYKNILRLKQLYNDISYDNMDQFLIDLSNERLYRSFKSFYSLFFSLVDTLLRETLSRSDIITQNLGFGFESVLKYDYYLTGTLVHSINGMDIYNYDSFRKGFLIQDINGITVYNTQYQLISHLDIPNINIFKVFISKNDKDMIIIYSHEPRSISVWNLLEGTLVLNIPFKNHIFRINSFTKDGNTFLIDVDKKDVITINLDDGDIEVIISDTHELDTVFVVNNTTIITKGEYLKLWNLRFIDKSVFVKEIEGMYVPLFHKLSETKILIQRYLKSFIIWDLETGILNTTSIPYVNKILVLYDGNFITINNNKLDLFDSDGFHKLSFKDEQLVYIKNVDLLPNNQLIITHYEEAIIWNPQNGNIDHRINLPPHEKLRVLFNGKIGILKEGTQVDIYE